MRTVVADLDRSDPALDSLSGAIRESACVAASGGDGRKAALPDSRRLLRGKLNKGNYRDLLSASWTISCPTKHPSM